MCTGLKKKRHSSTHTHNNYVNRTEGFSTLVIKCSWWYLEWLPSNQSFDKPISGHKRVVVSGGQGNGLDRQVPASLLQHPYNFASRESQLRVLQYN